jgi:hypothetical protein
VADPYFDLTTTLLPFEAFPNADESSVVDRAGAPGVWSLNGSVALSTTWKQFGSRSIRFAANGDAIYREDTRVANFGDSPFCIEGWINADAVQPGLYPFLFVAFPDNTYNWKAGAFALCVDNKNDSPGKLSAFAANYTAGNTKVLESTTDPRGAGSLHFAVTRDESSVWRMFINGQKEAETTWAGAVNNGGGMKHVAIGSDTRLASSDTSYRGYLDEFRVTIGVPRYTANFTVPTSAFEYKEVSARARSKLVRALLNFSFPAAPIARRSLGVRPRRDTVFLGRGVIAGTVKQKATPSNVPLRRRVLLLDETTNIIMRETWSDATTGDYVFDRIDPARRYSVITYDYAKNYRAVVADNLIPEAMS